ncbi:methyltransferase [Klebsiella variicola]|uniref:methyltransferase n=1 Tax=Klebsiella pneumoniae complex TaxID=3390273 RepID=UPI0020A33D33|nr:class I SAM-dependent methyltransferase [Klebsiella variicola]MDD9258965.1 class I SAM-dependent methyltransferase [Klebsiella variicola]MDE1513137.1 class I SAM-dependent methyltransferase [Serratia nevei]
MHVTQDVLSVLSDCQFQANQLVLPDQLDRSLYVKTNKVIELAGGKWNRKAKAHLFPDNAEERIELVILTASVDKPKDDFNFFPTSQKVIRQMLDSVSLRAGDRVLEPSCGDGRILYAAYQEQPDIILTGIELEPVRAALLRKNELITSTGAELVECDFLSWNPTNKFDVILMNPPFIKSADIHHVDHAISMLDKGGRLSAVMSAGVKFRNTRLIKAFRERVASLGGEFFDLEPGSFKESGTMVNTVLLELIL